VQPRTIKIAFPKNPDSYNLINLIYGINRSELAFDFTSDKQTIERAIEYLVEFDPAIQGKKLPIRGLGYNLIYRKVCPPHVTDLLYNCASGWERCMPDLIASIGCGFRCHSYTCRTSVDNCGNCPYYPDIKKLYEQITNLKQFQSR